MPDQPQDWLAKIKAKDSLSNGEIDRLIARVEELELSCLSMAAICTKASDLVRHSRFKGQFASDHFRMTWKEFENAVMTYAAAIRALKGKPDAVSG